MERFCLLAAVLLPSAAAGVPAKVVVVTGATGRTGALLFKALQGQPSVEVRGLVRNATKARQVLNCTTCDPSDGIFVGDVTKKETLSAVMEGATTLAITTSAIPECKDFRNPKTCTYPKGGFPVDVDWNGGKAQVEAFAKAGRNGASGQVLLCSSMGTTQPDSFLDLLGDGHIGFYKLNEEAFVMSAGLPYTIVKPCGLVDTPPGKNTLVVGHDDQIHESPPTVTRGDVARVMAAAIAYPEGAKNLRFDLCSHAGEPTTDLAALFAAARWEWQEAVTTFRDQASSELVV